MPEIQQLKGEKESNVMQALTFVLMHCFNQKERKSEANEPEKKQ